MNINEQLTVKELAAYCNQLCEEGHCNAPVQMALGNEPALYDVQLESCMYELDKLRLMPDPMFRLYLPKSFVSESIYASPEEDEILKECHEEYMNNMNWSDRDELRDLLKHIAEAI